MEEILKICTKCTLNKPLSDYSHCKRGKYNKQPKCKDCNKTYREENREKINTYLNNYYQENKEELIIKNTQRVQDNYESVQEYKKKWYLENKEEITEKIKLRYIDNKKSIQDYKKEYYQINKKEICKNNTYMRNERRKGDFLFDLKLNISGTIRNSLKKKYKKSKRTQEILGCTLEFFKNHLESQFLPWMTWEKYGKYNGSLNFGFDIDHIIPVSYAKTEEEIYLLNHWSNFQPLCSKVNRDIKKANVYPCSNLELNITYE